MSIEKPYWWHETRSSVSKVLIDSKNPLILGQYGSVYFISSQVIDFGYLIHLSRARAEPQPGELHCGDVKFGSLVLLLSPLQWSG